MFRAAGQKIEFVREGGSVGIIHTFPKHEYAIAVVARPSSRETPFTPWRRQSAVVVTNVAIYDITYGRVVLNRPLPTRRDHAHPDPEWQT